VIPLFQSHNKGRTVNVLLDRFFSVESRPRFGNSAAVLDQKTCAKTSGIRTATPPSRRVLPAVRSWLGLSSKRLLEEDQWVSGGKPKMLLLPQVKRNRAALSPSSLLYSSKNLCLISLL